MEIRIAPDVAIQAASAGSEATPPSIPQVPPPPAIANISPFGDLLGKLRQLADTSPDELRAVAAHLQASLGHAAQEGSGTLARSAGDLAQRFGEVARTGSLAALQASAASSPHGPELSSGVAAQLGRQVDAALGSVRAVVDQGAG